MMKREMPFWLMFLIFGLIGTVFFVVGICLMQHHNKLNRLCDDEVTAVVAEMAVHKGGEGGTTYAPVYEYTYNGQFYRITSNMYSNPPLYQAGDRTSLRIRSDDPTQFLDPKQKPWLAIIFSIIGGVFVVVSLIAAVIGAMSKKKMVQN